MQYKIVADSSSNIRTFEGVDFANVPLKIISGDREFIETRTKTMCDLFRAAGGGWIAKDYPTYHDIGVDVEWAKWARDVITENSAI